MPLRSFPHGFPQLKNIGKIAVLHREESEVYSAWLADWGYIDTDRGLSNSNI
jgi:hypothetical protein